MKTAWQTEVVKGQQTLFSFSGDCPLTKMSKRGDSSSKMNDTQIGNVVYRVNER